MAGRGVLFYNREVDFLPLIHEGRLIEGDFLLLPCIGKRQPLPVGVEHIALGGGDFLDDIAAQRHIVQRDFAVFIGNQRVGNNIALLVAQASVRSINRAVRVDAIGRACKPARFVMEGHAAVRHVRAGQHLALLGDLQSGGLFFILDENGYAVTVGNIHRKGRPVQAITFRGLDFADVQPGHSCDPAYNWRCRFHPW